jgi:hypothetical protein
MAGFDGEIRDVCGERGELDGRAAGACAEREETEVAWSRGSGGGCRRCVEQVETYRSPAGLAHRGRRSGRPGGRVSILYCDHSRRV